MATGNDTKATQTEEEEDDYSHLTANNINFKCTEGINARLDSFKVINKNAFAVRLELDGKKYKGWFIEAVDSFAPVNLIKPKKRRLPTFHKRSKTQHSEVKLAKKPTAYCRKNYPQSYVDTHNTIAERLRYGRDKKNPEFNTLHVAGNSSPYSKDNSVLSGSNRKKKSQCFVADSQSNEDSPFRKRKYKRKRRYLKESLESNEYYKLAEAVTSNENSSPSCSVFMIPSTPEYNINCNQDEEISEASSDTSSRCSETKIQYSPSKNRGKEISVIHKFSDTVVQGQSFDSEPEHMALIKTKALSPIMKTKARPKDSDTPKSATSSRVSWSRMSEPDLMTFSPVVNTGKQCKEEHVAAQSQPPEPDLIIFSPEISNETRCKKHVIQRPSVIQVIKNKKALLFSPQTEAPRTSSETVSPQFFHKKPGCRLEKLGDISCMKGGDSILNTRESFNHFTESKLQNTPGVRESSFNDQIKEKIAPNKDTHRSSVLKFQCKPIIVDEIQCTNDSNSSEIATLNKGKVHQHMKCSKSYKGTIDTSPGIDSERKLQRFESVVTVNTTDISDKKNKRRLSGRRSVSLKSISKNNPKEGKIRSRSDDTEKTTVRKKDVLPQLSEPRLPEDHKTQCTKDNTDLEKISREFPFQRCLERKPSNNSRNKETGLYFFENTVQNSTSNESSSHQRRNYRLKNFQRDVEAKLSCNNDGAMADTCYNYKSQPSFKGNESTRHVLKDSNVLCGVQNEITNSEILGRIEVKGPFKEKISVQNLVENKLQCGPRKIESAFKNVENEVLDNTFDDDDEEIKLVYNSSKDD